MNRKLGWAAYIFGGTMVASGVAEVAGIGLMSILIGMLFHWRFWLLFALGIFLGFWIGGE